MATRLQDVNAAQKEAQQQGSALDSLDNIIIPGETLPEEEKKDQPFNVLFKLVKKKKGRLWLDNCCDNVINPTTKKPERIWLLNGARSIWDSDLEYILKDKPRYERSRRGRDIVFVDGVLRVPSTDVLMIEFLRNNSYNTNGKKNGSGKYSFYEYDPQQEQKDRMAKQLVKIEMVIKAKEMPIDKAKKLASFLGISFVDELGQLKTDDGIKTELMVRADTDPATFQKHIDSREVEISWLVRKALVEGKIDAASGNGSVTWANGKGLICKMPSTVKPHAYLTELALTNSEEGRRFKEQLETSIT